MNQDIRHTTSEEFEAFSELLLPKNGTTVVTRSALCAVSAHDEPPTGITSRCGLIRRCLTPLPIRHTDCVLHKQSHHLFRGDIQLRSREMSDRRLQHLCKGPTMKRTAFVLSSAALLTAALGLGVAAGESPQVKKDTPSAPATNAKEEPKKTERSTSERDEKKPSSQQAADEDAIQATADSYVKAYRSRDAKAVAAHFTSDAEYIDENGNVYEGRQEIEELLAACFEKNPEIDMELEIGVIRFISPGVALEDGSLTVSYGTDGEPVDTQYTAIHVKNDGKWQMASVREKTPKERRQHRIQLNQLSWLEGEWIDEDKDSTVFFACAPIDNGNFLLREFVLIVDGDPAISGSQRIGWDPLTGKLRTWIFDSEGGYGEGFWYRDDDRWILKTIGVTAEGEMASSTSIYKKVNDHTMTWQCVDHEIGGERFPDSDVITIVRRAEAPTALDESDLKAQVKEEVKAKAEEKPKQEPRSK